MLRRLLATPQLPAVRIFGLERPTDSLRRTLKSGANLVRKGTTSNVLQCKSADGWPLAIWKPPLMNEWRLRKMEWHERGYTLSAMGDYVSSDSSGARMVGRI